MSRECGNCQGCRNDDGCYAEGFDDSPTSVTVNDVRIIGQTAYFAVTDAHDENWIVTLDVGMYSGGKYWFAQTVESRVRESGSFVLTSTYDSQADEWFVRAGNYSIHSKNLQFTAEKP